MGAIAIEKRAMRGMGQLLQHALPCRRRPSEMGVVCRRSRVHRGVLGAAKAVDPRRRMRGSLGYTSAVHRRYVQSVTQLVDLRLIVLTRLG